MTTFTDLSLKSLSPPEQGQITVAEANSPLRVRISQGGSITFFVTIDGSGRRHVIGRFGEVSLKDAREAARRLRAQKTLGRVLPAPVRLETARTQYLNEIDIRDATRTYYERNLNRLTGRKISDITPHQVTTILGSLSP